MKAKLTPDAWLAASPFLDELLALPPSERAPYIEKLRSTSQTIAADLNLLLEEHRLLEQAQFLEHSLPEVSALPAEAEQTGLRCGPYRLLSLIGRGGMGAVYLAERADGELAQRLAIKLLPHSAGSIHQERFLQERQILATLAHPNIARMLDAGHTASGQPFLAMEYVEGRPIDVYAATLNRPQKIALFQKVCQAVSYLHRNLIVHRDLKPGNILVTAEGEPKLLDFGIAKILDLASDSEQTAIRVLTPAYASPEQFAGERIGTASDLYSLGAILYELLTQKPAHTQLDSPPEGPSHSPRNHQITHPSKWLPDLAGDLESILLKALSKDPQDRYATAEQFAEDLQSFLDSKPVRARSANFAYLTAKFLRRHWLPVAAALLMIAGLTTGLYIANRERALAQRRFNEVRQLSNQLFNIDRQVRDLPGSAKTRQLIVDTSLEYLARLASDARSDPTLALDLGTAYMRVGRVQGVPISANLGQSDNAEKNLRMAQDLVDSVLKAQPANRTAFLRTSQIAHDRMVLAQARRPNTEALPLARQSQTWLEKYLATGPIEEAEKEQVVIIGMNVANWLLRQEFNNDGLLLLHRTIEIAKATNQPRQAGAAQIVVTRLLRSEGKLEEALAAIQDGVRLLEPSPGDKSVSVGAVFGLALSTQGDVLGAANEINLGRYKEATLLYERGYQLALAIARQDSADADSRLRLSGRGMRLAGALRQSDPKSALSVYDEVLARLHEVKNNSRARRDEARALAASTLPLIQIGRSAEASRRLERALSLLKDLKLYPAAAVEPGSEAFEALCAQAELNAAAGDIPRGLKIYQDLAAQILASTPKPEASLEAATDLSNLYRAMTKLHLRAGKPDLASILEAQRQGLWRQWERKMPGNSYVARQLAATSLSPAKRPAN